MLGAVAAAIIEGGRIGWSNSWVLAGFGGFVILAALFLVQERRSRHPMLPLSLFSQRMFALTSLDGLLVNVAFYGLIFVFSLYFQQINGWSAFATGLAFVPMMGAVLPANLVAARLTKRFGAPATIAGGALISPRVPRDWTRHRLLGRVRTACRHGRRLRLVGAAADVDAPR